MAKDGIIFNMQKFSLHDGPGIRTVVFFKGCPLRCKWCSNPESLSGNIQITCDSEKCLRCARCICFCDAEAIALDNDNIIINHDKCTACFKCVEVCTAKALGMEGERRSVQEVIDYVMQDIDFYNESGGGVTLSGGEMSAQPEFAVNILNELKKKGIHTACETSGYCRSDIFANIIKHVDLILFDIKHYDRQKHFQATGVYNDIILNNLVYAASSGCDIIARIPVIPDFNDSLDDAANFARLIRSAGIIEVNLLPFHRFGEKKYSLLGKKYEMENVLPLHKEDLEQYKQVFNDYNLVCKI